MVKSVLGDETQFKSTETRLFTTNPPSEVGLVIGKLNPTLDRAFIFNLIPTPPNDNSQSASSLTSTTTKKKPTAKPSPQSILLDIDWISEHARQVSQMLLGGVHVIGLYIWAPESCFPSSTVVILEVLSAFGGEFVVHFCYSPRKLIVRNCAPVSTSFRVCEMKLGRVLGSLRSFKCLYEVEMKLPISKEGCFRDVVREGILGIGKELRDAKAVVDGELGVDDDHQLVVSDGDHNVELLLPFGRDCGGGGDVKGEVVGIVVFRGSVCSVAYLSSKESVGQAISDIKGDIIASLQSRLNIMCDEAEENMEEGSVTRLGLHLLETRTTLSFPRRVLVPWIGDTFVCDYLQPAESFDVVKDHCKELMSLEAPADTSLILEPEKEAISLTMKSFWDVVVPSYSASALDSKSMVKEKDSMPKEGSQTSVKSATFNTVTAIAILLLAIVIGFLVFRS